MLRTLKNYKYGRYDLLVNSIWGMPRKCSWNVITCKYALLTVFVCVILRKSDGVLCVRENTLPKQVKLYENREHAQMRHKAETREPSSSETLSTTVQHVSSGAAQRTHRPSKTLSPEDPLFYVCCNEKCLFLRTDESNPNESQLLLTIPESPYNRYYCVETTTAVVIVLRLAGSTNTSYWFLFFQI